jgi:RNA recognition motif-containing protein
MMSTEPALWWYLDADGQCVGPIDKRAVIALFYDETVHGMTLVHPDGSPHAAPPPPDSTQWAPLADMPPLRNAIGGFSDSDHSCELQEINGLDTYQLAPPSEMIAPPSEKIPPPCEMIAPPSAELHIRPRSVPATQGNLPEGTIVRTSHASSALGSGPDMSGAAERESKRILRRRKRAVARARDRAQRTIFVENVPHDATERELVAFFSKCGIVMPDARTGRPSVTLYLTVDAEGTGAARIIYAMEPSVENALLLLDGCPLRVGGSPIRLTRARFDENEYWGKAKSEQVLVRSTADGFPDPPPLKRHHSSPPARGQPAKMKGNATHVVVREALGWADEGQKVGRSLRIVVLKHLFDPNDPELDYEDVRADLESGCRECGPIEKITIFKGNSEGVATVKFEDGHGARKCVERMHQRWYDRRQLVAEFYDGETDYRVTETGEQRKQRLALWDKWLSGDEQDGNGADDQACESNAASGQPRTEQSVIEQRE